MSNTLGELEPSLVAAKASSFPLNRPIVRSRRSNKIRQQIHGTVEIVEHRPRYLTRQNRKDIVDPKGHLQSLPKLRPNEAENKQEPWSRREQRHGRRAFYLGCNSWEPKKIKKLMKKSPKLELQGEINTNPNPRWGLVEFEKLWTRGQRSWRF